MKRSIVRLAMTVLRTSAANAAMDLIKVGTPCDTLDEVDEPLHPTTIEKGIVFASAKITIAAAAGLCLLLGISAASADPIDDRANELLPWVAQRTGYAAEHVKVTVLFVEPRTINLIAYGISKDDDPKPEAISAGATIFLPTWFELGKNDDILVHELTHVLQYVNDAKFRCRMEQEKQAYEAQSAFVDETGIGKKPDPFAMFMLHCTAYPVRNPVKESAAR